MKSPAHPGEILATMYLEPLGLTVTQAAAALNMPRAALVGNRQWRARRNSANRAEAAKSLQSARRFLAVGAIAWKLIEPKFAVAKPRSRKSV